MNEENVSIEVNQEPIEENTSSPERKDTLYAIPQDPNIHPKYGDLDKKTISLLEQYELQYFREDLPVPFCGLLLYPATVRDFEKFSAGALCLSLDKNTDVAGIAKSHLDYFKFKMEDPQEGIQWSWRFQTLVETIFHIKNGVKCKKCGHVISYLDSTYLEYQSKFIELQKILLSLKDKSEDEIDPAVLEKLNHLPFLECPECHDEHHEFNEILKFAVDDKNNTILKIDGHTITKKDFNFLRQVVFFQNFADYTNDSWVDPELKKDREEKIRLERQKNDVHASIEKKVVCLSITTNYKFAEIYDMSIRKFTMALATVDDLINYKIMRQAVTSGFTSLPKGQTVEHWIYKPQKDMYGDSYKSLDNIRDSASRL